MAREKTIRLGKYKHFKRDEEYEVLGIAHHSETNEAFVVYRALYGDKLMWIRPYTMFIQWVWHEGDTIPRFKYLGPIS